MGGGMEESEYTGAIVPSQHDIAHMGDIIAGSGDWFSADLLRLIRKADGQNRERLRQVFPEHVRAFEDWYNG